MFHAETNTPALARTSNLNEELGQVQMLLCKVYICFNCCQARENDWYYDHFIFEALRVLSCLLSGDCFY